MQTKFESFIESCTNTVIGYIIAIISQMIIFPLVGIETSLKQNMLIALYFTLISIVRTFLIRRYFNNKSEKKEKISS